MFKALRVFVPLCLLGLGCATSGVSSGRTEFLTDLSWRATSALEGPLPAQLAGHRVSVEVVGDNRPEPRARVGINVQNPGHTLNLSATNNVDNFVAYGVAHALRSRGIEVVPQGGDRVLRLTVNELLVTEENTYQARAAFQAELVDGGGRAIWSGTFAGQNSRWGRTFAEENYLECLSDVIVNALAHMFVNMSGGFEAPPSPGAPPPPPPPPGAVPPPPGGPSTPLNLTWRATSRLESQAPQQLLGHTVSIEVVGDNRPEPHNRVAVNLQNPNYPRYFAATSNVHQFVVNGLSTILRNGGVDVVPQGGERVLKLTLNEYMVTESNTYQARVSLHADLVGRGGRRIWSGVINGNNSRWGRSMSEENYLECLSDVLVDATSKWFSNVANAGPGAGEGPPSAPPPGGARNAPPPPPANPPPPPGN